MIDLAAIRQWGTTALALLFFVLWQHSERQQSKALEIAAATVGTTEACIASYGDSAAKMGKAVADLTTALRAE